MIGRLGRLVLRITLAGVIIGVVTAALGIGAIAIAELLGRRRESEPASELASESAAENPAPPQELDEEFLSLLACPICKTSVTREGDRLVCGTCGRRYPIRDGIPVMLADEAELPGSEAPASA